MSEIINIGKRREFFWDETILDRENSGTISRMHEPVLRDKVLTLDNPWDIESGTCMYLVVLQDGDIYRMYMRSGNLTYAESKDGIHWEMPDLGIVEYNGSKHNNILIDKKDFSFDSFRPFIDENPDCLPEERIKAVGHTDKYEIYLFASPDGIHFNYKGKIPISGGFDSVNTIFWNKHKETYQAFVRDFHPAETPQGSGWTRDIHFSESKEIQPLENWKTPQAIVYNQPTDWQMYINSIFPYYRGDHVLVGFPSRYVNRTKWTNNFDELCGAEARKERMKLDPRYGLSINDTMFMTSRDGFYWYRYPDAFLRPGPEHLTNWVYGSVYFSNGLVETQSCHPGCDNEISFYCVENRWFEKPWTAAPHMPAEIYRYTIRLDGFVSQFAPFPATSLFTKPFIFEGNDLFINFSTSAFGKIILTIKTLDGSMSTSTDPMFGDSTNRRVHFDKPLSDFAGKPVLMSADMCDADFYSFKFE